jgi:hypothetical protein
VPQIFKLGSYWVYFWSNESQPLEPIHVHVSKGAPNGNSTKIWITQTGKCLPANNNSKIPEKVLNNIIRIIETQAFDIISKWKDFFGVIEFYC